MVFYICIVGGIGVGLAMALSLAPFGYSISDINPLVTYVVPMVPVFLYILYKGKEAASGTAPLRESCKSSRNISVPVLAILVILATIASMVLTEPLTSLVPMPESVKDVYRKMLSDPIWTTLSVAVAAPLIEEFLLRGVMMRGMLRHTTPIQAIHHSAFFFALIHMNLSQALGAFVMGLFIGWIYYKTGSLWFAILIHFINNGLGVVFTMAFPDNLELTFMELIIQEYNIITYIGVYMATALAFGAIIRHIHKRIRNEQESEVISI